MFKELFFLLCVSINCFAYAKNNKLDFIPDGQFGVYNNCSMPIWIQAENQPSEDSSLIKLEPQTGYSYHINGQKLPSFSAIPKFNCDQSGNNCETGQSLDPCPSYGCQPAIDTKFEASFNDTSTFYDVSVVNGFTLPFTLKVIKASNESNTACLPSDGSNLDIKKCPTKENLSTPFGSMNRFGKYKFGPFLKAINGTNNSIVSLTNVDLRLTNPHTENQIGCYAPVEKMAAGNWGGFGIGANSHNPAYNAGYYSAAIMYSCPFRSSELLSGIAPDLTDNLHDNLGFRLLSEFCKKTPGFCTQSDPNGVAAHLICNLGPLPNTKYVRYIHANTTNVYAFQYDDSQQLVCDSKQTKIVFQLCGN